MSVEIRFIGLCLFNRPGKGETSMKVWLPNARNPSGKPYIDGTKATPHYAYLVANENDVSSRSGPFESRDGFVFSALSGTVVSFGTKGDAPNLDDFTDVADFGKFGGCLELSPDASPDDPAVLAGQVVMSGGRMFTAATSRVGPWTFNDTLEPGHEYEPPLLAWELRWDTGLDKLDIGLANHEGKDGSLTIDSKGSTVTVTLGNVCEEDPTTWDALPEQPCPGGEVVIDNDFKWLYQIFVPCGGKSWGDVLKGRLLPAPTVDCPAAAVRGASTPTCYGGSWP